ncbi:MAG: hypothetical protein NXI31_14840 [bacterium]|nr:hypothetical protein [bacterium]
MNHSVTAILALLATSTVASAQSCLFHPSDTPAVGAPDPRPFGNGNPNDPTYGTMRYQVKVPAAVLGNQQLEIVELAVAPASSQVRSFGEIQIRMGHSPNPLSSSMGSNMVGFTARPVQHLQVSLPSTVDEWMPLGMAFSFRYLPSAGDLVIEFFTRGSGATGPGNPGFRTDPSIPFVWRTGAGYNNANVEAGGGIKLRLCTDTNNTIVYGEGGCQGSNGLTPQLDYSGSAQLGSTLNIHATDGPSGATSLAVLVWSFRTRSGPFALDGFGATGCSAYVYDDVVSWLVIGGGSHTVSLPLAPGLAPGLPLWNQWFFIDPPANPLGLTSSNFGRFLIGN